MNETIRVLTELAEELEAEAAKYRSPAIGHLYNLHAAQAVRNKIRQLELIESVT